MPLTGLQISFVCAADGRPSCWPRHSRPLLADSGQALIWFLSCPTAPHLLHKEGLPIHRQHTSHRPMASQPHCDHPPTQQPTPQQPPGPPPIGFLEAATIKKAAHTAMSVDESKRATLTAQISQLYWPEVNKMLERFQQHIEEELVRLGLRGVLSFTVSDLDSAFKVVYLLEQSWEEVAEVLQWASQCDCCTLPLSLTADDINTHWSETVYMALPRVLAQLMVVGRHVRFRDGSCLRFLRRANGEVRGPIEPGFRLVFNPPLAAGHLYQQHRLEHDPPVRSRNIYYNGRTWVSHAIPSTDASVSSVSSVSSFVKNMILDHYRHVRYHRTNRTSIVLNRRVAGGRLNGLLTQSPHTSVAGCTTTFSNSGARVRYLVLTDSSHDFVAWIRLEVLPTINDVRVSVVTTEARVCASGAFKDRFRQTTQLGSEALGRGLEVVFDGQVVQDELPSEWSVDDSDDDEDGGGESEAEGDDDDDGYFDGGDDDDDDDMHSNDGQEASGGSDEYSELLGREGGGQIAGPAAGVAMASHSQHSGGDLVDVDSGDGPAAPADGLGGGGGSSSDLLQTIRSTRSVASQFASDLEEAENIIATHTDNTPDGASLAGRLTALLGDLTGVRSAVNNQLAGITDHHTTQVSVVVSPSHAATGAGAAGGGGAGAGGGSTRCHCAEKRKAAALSASSGDDGGEGDTAADGRREQRPRGEQTAKGAGGSSMMGEQ
ncbi:unnamed protein product [Vitrella brassicaformis CCMP3155]|uniref:Uncharacterized protein n=2 Tax=Vitrella brassicaformis TaxID=1169539 RepID=A0A0G4EE17_VITBC|nr:unnamed protein product [Vitrella brassicaformis CCMP3155]|eukprot:CEL93574.1 unnamed protein product [Vitrella brassicaformis CCMP3155]